MRARFALGLALCVFAACQRPSPAKDAEAALDHGDVSRATFTMEEHLRKNPDDKEARLVLARAYLRTGRVDDVTNTLKPIENDPEFAPRIAAAYAEGAMYASKRGDITPMTRYAVAAAQYDPTRKQQSCQTLLAYTRRVASGRAMIAPIAASIDEPCKRAVLTAAQDWIRNADLKDFYHDKFDLEAIANAGLKIDPNAANDIAHALRDLAQRTLAKDNNQALQILEIAYRVDPSVRNERETSELRSHLTQATINAALQEQVHGMTSPLAKTKRTMEQIGAVIAQYTGEHSRAPLAHSFDELERELAPYIRGALPHEDGWGHPYEYISSADSKSYRIISGGDDGKIDEASRKLNGRTYGVTSETGADLIYEDGHFIQEPADTALLQYDARPVTH